jgi:hypothetical protein
LLLGAASGPSVCVLSWPSGADSVDRSQLALLDAYPLQKNKHSTPNAK